MTTVSRVLATAALGGLGFLAWSSGCGSPSSSDNGNVQSGAGQGGNVFTAVGGNGDASTVAPKCITTTGQCVRSCSGTATSISGTVYDPAGADPLYGVVAYVPSQPPGPISTGASCYSCDSLYTGNPIAYAVTDAAGHFSIANVPDGTNIPLVIQVGKWRMQYTIPNVTQCQDNAAATLLGVKLSLPHNHTVGDIPNIAIATGGADSLECLLERVGLDAAEYGGGPGGAGHIHIFQGDGGANTSPAGPVASAGLWNSQADLMGYDIVLLACEGHETTKMNQQALFDYATAGGRVFASHFHYAWFNTGPFGAENLAPGRRAHRTTRSIPTRTS
jgi:hypothetical protein